ncbi:amidase, partial [Dietzia sp. DQ11-44]|nr:amidase [Dietzia sp. DQ11-44]MBB1049107.1 amidase [Dietzia cercidiphylli]
MRSGADTATGALDAALDRIAHLDPALRAFTTLLGTDGRAAAAAVDARDA